MNETTRASFGLAFGAVSSLLVADGAAAQTCGSPQLVAGIVSGTTCGSNTMPTQTHGAIRTMGDDLIFLPTGFPYGVDMVFLYGQPHELFVFVCSGCGVNAECFDSDETNDAGRASVQYPHDGRLYNIIVDSPSQGCLDYDLNVIGPLKAEP